MANQLLTITTIPKSHPRICVNRSQGIVDGELQDIHRIRKDQKTNHAQVKVAFHSKSLPSMIWNYHHSRIQIYYRLAISNGIQRLLRLAALHCLKVPYSYRKRGVLLFREVTKGEKKALTWQTATSSTFKPNWESYMSHSSGRFVHIKILIWNLIWTSSAHELLFFIAAVVQQWMES